MKIYGTRTGIDFARYATFYLFLLFLLLVSDISFDRKIIYWEAKVQQLMQQGSRDG